MAFKVPNQYRLRTGPYKSDDSAINCGAFEIPTQNKGKKFILSVIASAGCDEIPISRSWEHVSCHKRFMNQRFVPSWNDMCKIKKLFWDDEDCVIQYHPPKSEYVNINPYVLHLWRPVGIEIPRPPKELL